jgi:phosphoglycolate phosphatase
MDSPAPLIVFDLDGTLIDTAPDLISCLNEIIMAEGLEAVDAEAMRPQVGFGSRVMLSRAYEMAGKHLLDEKLDLLVKDFIKLYGENMPGSSKPFDGVLDAMSALRDKGFKFAVCTNKTEILANKLLDALDISQWLEAVTGQDTFSIRKPHPDHLLKTIEMAHGTAKQAIMVGDTPTDFSTAKAASIPVIAVDFGYCDSPVDEFEPDKIISHYSEMTPELVLSLINN